MPQISLLRTVGYLIQLTPFIATIFISGQRKNKQMWHLQKIPKRIFLYWGRNRKLSFLRYLTVQSFSRLNPDWLIEIYYPNQSNKKINWVGEEQKSFAYNGIDYFDRLTDFASLVEIDVSQQPYWETLSEVHRSDLLRWQLLSQYGGLWSDFDILYFRPINDSAFNLLENAKTDVVVCYHNKHRFAAQWNTIGFLMGGREKSYHFYSDIYDRALSRLRNMKQISYQTLGRGVMDEYFCFGQEKASCHIVNAPFETVYPTYGHYVAGLFSVNSGFRLPGASIGIHWYAGSPFAATVERTIINVEILKKYLHLPIFQQIERIL